MGPIFFPRISGIAANEMGRDLLRYGGPKKLRCEEDDRLLRRVICALVGEGNCKYLEQLISRSMQ